MHLNAKNNEYARILGDLLDAAPKAVIAAIVVSLLIKEDADYKPGHIQNRFFGEWETLHQNGIVSQKPKRRKRIIQ